MIAARRSGSEQLRWLLLEVKLKKERFSMLKFLGFNLQDSTKSSRFRCRQFAGEHSGGLPKLMICLDGQSLDCLTVHLTRERLPASHPPFVLVGIESRPSSRAQEYCPDASPEVYQEHQRLIERAIRWAGKEWRIPQQAESLAIFGFSNGALAALSTAFAKPQLFGTVVAFSPSGGAARYTESIDQTSCLPRVYLAAGSREVPFRKTVEQLSETLKPKNVDVVKRVRPNQTHNMELWSTEFPNAISWWLTGTTPVDDN